MDRGTGRMHADALKGAAPGPAKAQETIQTTGPFIRGEIRELKQELTEQRLMTLDATRHRVQCEQPRNDRVCIRC